MKSLRRSVHFWMIVSIAAIAIAFVTPLNHLITVAQDPMFRDLVTGVAIDDQLDPQARAILEAAVQSGGLPADFDAGLSTMIICKLKVFAPLVLEQLNRPLSRLIVACKFRELDGNQSMFQKC